MPTEAEWGLARRRTQFSALQTAKQMWLGTVKWPRTDSPSGVSNQARRALYMTENVGVDRDWYGEHSGHSARDPGGLNRCAAGHQGGCWMSTDRDMRAPCGTIEPEFRWILGLRLVQVVGDARTDSI